MPQLRKLTMARAANIKITARHLPRKIPSRIIENSPVREMLPCVSTLRTKEGVEGMMKYSRASDFDDFEMRSKCSCDTPLDRVLGEKDRSSEESWLQTTWMSKYSSMNALPESVDRVPTRGILAKLNAEQRSALLSSGHLSDAAAGELLYLAEDRPEFVGLIVEGFLRSSSATTRCCWVP